VGITRQAQSDFWSWGKGEERKINEKGGGRSEEKQKHNQARESRRIAPLMGYLESEGNGNKKTRILKAKSIAGKIGADSAF